MFSVSGKNKTAIVFESPSKWNSFFIRWHLRRRASVWIVEPFHAYHHKRGLRFFPPHHPAYVERLVHQGKISVIKAADIGARFLYMQAADKGVDIVESIYPQYKKKLNPIIRYVSEVLKSGIAETVFKINLCENLAEFYSVNIFLERIEEYLKAPRIIIYPDTNIFSYNRIKRLLMHARQSLFVKSTIRFPFEAYLRDCGETLKKRTMATARLFVQSLVSGLIAKNRSRKSHPKSTFLYAAAVLSRRQLRGNQRGPAFFVDHKTIFEKEVICFSSPTLGEEKKVGFDSAPDIENGEPATSLRGYRLPQKGRFFSHFSEWVKLLRLVLRKNLSLTHDEIMAAANLFFSYFLWRNILMDISFKHFISHCDFGIPHVGRNIALNQAGVQTWYFTDTMNSMLNFRDAKAHFKGLHPFWTYLYYDHFVTWDDALAEYYQEHPGTFKQSHVVGCIWAGHIQKKEVARKHVLMDVPDEPQQGFLLSCFDSTYSRNGQTNYEEGLRFAQDLYRLATEVEDIRIILKEKKGRRIHHMLDPVFGPELLSLYNNMEQHPRIKIVSNQEDASKLISISDLVVSFPFTSTTFEALAVNRPAIWHDAGGVYRSSIYGKIEGVVTHNYDELKTKVLEMKGMKPSEYKNPFPVDSPLMDPFRDGKAIERFIELLHSS